MLGGHIATPNRIHSDESSGGSKGPRPILNCSKLGPLRRMVRGLPTGDGAAAVTGCSLTTSTGGLSRIWIGLAARTVVSDGFFSPGDPETLTGFGDSESATRGSTSTTTGAGSSASGIGTGARSIVIGTDVPPEKALIRGSTTTRICRMVGSEHASMELAATRHAGLPTSSF